MFLLIFSIFFFVFFFFFNDTATTEIYTLSLHDALPILVPLADLFGLSRQVTVLAYQYGGGLCELFTPTNGALMAILAAAQVRYEDWLRFAVPLLLTLLALGAGAVGLGVAIGLQ